MVAAGAASPISTETGARSASRVNPRTVLFITHSVEEAVGLSDRVLVMSPNPGRIVEEIVIDLPRPRPAHLGEYPSFNIYAERIHEAFKRLGVIKY